MLQESVDHSIADEESGSMQGKRSIMIRWREAQAGARITRAYKLPENAHLARRSR